MTASIPNRRFAVLSSDTNSNYSFFLPLAARAWKKLGWNPLCFLVEAREVWEKNPRAAFALSSTDPKDIAAFVLPEKGYRVSTTAQLVRLLASSLPKLKKSDYLITSDIDMIPLDGAHFLRQDWSMDFNVLGADAYADLTKGLFPPKFPMCYLGATVGAWRDVMGLSTEDIQEEIRKALLGRLDSWDNDEMYFSSKLYPHRFMSGKLEKVSPDHYRRGTCDLVIRTWASGRAYKRIDREVWGFPGNGMIDCHCPRPGYKNPEVLRKIFTTTFPEDASWFDEYLSGYLKAGESKGG